MYKIGDFSKIVDIPVRTLRYYAEYGVLVPSEIDKFTGYKYYSEANIIECELISLLILAVLPLFINDLLEFTFFLFFFFFFVYGFLELKY